MKNLGFSRFLTYKSPLIKRFGNIGHCICSEGDYSVFELYTPVKTPSGKIKAMKTLIVTKKDQTKKLEIGKWVNVTGYVKGKYNDYYGNTFPVLYDLTFE